MIVDKGGSKRWYLNNELHREDGPAVDSTNGTQLWFINGKPHREDGAASEWASGNKFWYLNGKQHREDGPAVEMADGTKFWYLNAILLSHPIEFDTMEEWFKHLNQNEEETYPLINEHNGFISFIDNPSARQVRLHTMKHVL